MQSSNNLVSIILITLFCFKFIPVVRTTPPTKEQAILRGRQRFSGFDNEKDYEYEIETGHKKHNDEKLKRQQGCLCQDHFYDPHCGSDFHTYDNGCYFLCGQERTPGLKLLLWRSCDSEEIENTNMNSIDNNVVDFDYDALNE